MSGSAVNVTQTLTAERDADGKPFARLVCTRCARAGGDSHAMLAQNGQVNLDKDRIHLWEFLNEPVYTSYALPSDREGKLGGKRYTPADYVALLEVAAKGMREADPACKVMGGIAGPPRTLTREVIEAGCLKHVDIFRLPSRARWTWPTCGSSNWRHRRSSSPTWSHRPAARTWCPTGRSSWAADSVDGNRRLGRRGSTVRNGRNGRHAGQIVPADFGLAATARPVLYFDYFDPVVKRELRPLAASLGWIKVEKGAAYTLSCDMRASVAGVRAVLG